MKKLGFGMMRLPKLDDDSTHIDIEKVKKMADEFLARGFTYFDTAAPYHKGFSEIAFREAVSSRYPRDAYTITDKLSLFMIKEAEAIPAFFDSQLEKLGVDYLDYYLLHALSASAYKKATDFGAFEFVAQKKAEGKIRHIGLSFHDKAEVLDKILTEHPEMEYVQIQYNYKDMDDVGIESRKCYDVCVKHGKPVIVMEPIKGGSLANVPAEAEKLFRDAEPDMSIASWAVRFAATPQNVVMVLSGMSNEEQMLDNLGYMEDFKPLSESELALCSRAADIIEASITIDCTACRYCVDDCPKQIAIPEYFAIYNNLKRYGGPQNMVANTYYANTAKTHGKASECIGCGKCEAHCPQHLPIRRFLEKIAYTFEKK